MPTNSTVLSAGGCLHAWLHDCNVKMYVIGDLKMYVMGKCEGASQKLVLVTGKLLTWGWCKLM